MMAVCRSSALTTPFSASSPAWIPATESFVSPSIDTLYSMIPVCLSATSFNCLPATQHWLQSANSSTFQSFAFTSQQGQVRYHKWYQTLTPIILTKPFIKMVMGKMGGHPVVTRKCTNQFYSVYFTVGMECFMHMNIRTFIRQSRQHNIAGKRQRETNSQTDRQTWNITNVSITVWLQAILVIIKTFHHFISMCKMSSSHW